LIAFEGIGGSGKSTQARKLTEFLMRRGVDVFPTREHTLDRPIGEMVERVIKRKTMPVDSLALQIAYTADRRDHWANVVLPVIEKGGVVVGDRWYGSTVAYAEEECRPLFMALNQLVVPRPDLIIYVGVRPEIGAERVNIRGGQDIFDSTLRLAKVADGYRYFFSNYGGDWVAVNGEMSEDMIHREIADAVMARELC